VIVFVLGGISQMEINALNNLAALTHKEIVIGSTSLLTPRDFVLEVGETEPLEADDEDAETPKAKKGEPKASGAQAAADRLDAQRRARASASQKQTAVDDVMLDSDDDAPGSKKPSTRGGVLLPVAIEWLAASECALLCGRRWWPSRQQRQIKKRKEDG
jgi:hypothetical protein